MNPSIKAVFFDIDSTLYYHGFHDIMPSAKQALWKLHEQGIKLGVATSRCHSEMKNAPSFFRTFPCSAIVSDGGALVMENNEIVKAEWVPSDVVQAFVDYAQRHHKTMRYSTVDGNYFMDMPRQQEKDMAFSLYLNLPKVKPYAHDNILNLLIHVGNETECDALYVQFKDRAALVNYHMALECTPSDTDKSKGIKTLADRWQLPMEEIMCFGDGENDVKMIQSCGIGVAMGNGCDAVKAAADFVTKRIEDDGVAYALTEYGLI